MTATPHTHVPLGEPRDGTTYGAAHSLQALSAFAKSPSKFTAFGLYTLWGALLPAAIIAILIALGADSPMLAPMLIFPGPVLALTLGLSTITATTVLSPILNGHPTRATVASVGGQLRWHLLRVTGVYWAYTLLAFLLTIVLQAALPLLLLIALMAGYNASVALIHNPGASFSRALSWALLPGKKSAGAMVSSFLTGMLAPAVILAALGIYLFQADSDNGMTTTMWIVAGVLSFVTLWVGGFLAQVMWLASTTPRLQEADGFTVDRALLPAPATA